MAKIKHAPVALIIMDGCGLGGKLDKSNAVEAAKTPVLDGLMANYNTSHLQASGEFVGLPDGQMGNSEVGHTNIGAGRLVYQQLTRITRDIKNGDFFKNEVLVKIMQDAKANGGAVHLLGLVSPGGVHSHQGHLYALLEMAKQQGVKDVYVHAFLDGRDVPPQSAQPYIEELEAKCKEIGVGKIATVAGRYYAMDRDHRWDREQKAYEAIAHAEGVVADDPVAGLKASYENGVNDEFGRSGKAPLVLDAYGINADGTLLPLADEWLLAAAGQFRTAALMHLSTLTEEGRFDNARSTLILEDADAQDALVQSILETVQARHYFGLDVDFEYVLPEQREAYAAFITRLREALNPLGCPVIVALAPKTSAVQRGLLYEAHDYALLSKAANAVFLMTYEWGYVYGEPQAIAPLPQVRAVLDYALSVTAGENIFLGAPLYAYDWPLPYEKGRTRAETLSSQAAVARARLVGAEIEFDETARSPCYHYFDKMRREHAVWFEDARSIEAKLRLADECHLQGVGYWNLTRPFPQNWAVLASLFDIETLL